MVRSVRVVRAPLATAMTCAGMTQRGTRARGRAGFSLLEMLAATAIVAGTLAPALSVMRDAMAISREAVQRNLVANYAVQVLEGQAALSMQNWSNGSATGNFASDGYSTIKYIATRSDAVASGGLVNRLMHIQVTAYEDKDADGVADANELKVTVRTKVAKLTNYTNAPN
jgi:prepilin-type N-terminal cleavage/methylation domain-containing protein